MAGTRPALCRSCLSRRRRRLSPPFVPEAHPIPFSKEKGASLFSRLTFSWFNDLIETGYHKTLDLADVPDLLQEDKAETVCARFDTIRPHHASLLASLYHLVRTEFLTQTAYAFVSAVLSFSGPFFLNRILNHVSHPKGTAAPLEGLAYATALLVCSVVRAVCDGQVFFTGRRIGTRVRAVVIGQVYAKALRRRATAPDADDETASATTGQITNLMAVDTAKILEVSCYLIYFWAYPLQIVICTTLLVVVLGWPALAGIAVMVAVLPVGGYLGKMVADKQKALIKATDARITAMNETLQGIRIIKFFAWENHYFAMLAAFRKTELVRLKAYLYTTAASRLVWYAAPILVSFLTFLTFTRLAGRDLTAEIAFTGLALFNALREPLKNFPDMIVRYTEAHVSLTRVQRFLDEEELERYGENKTPAPAGAPTCAGGGDGGGGGGRGTASSGDSTTAPVPAVGFKGPAAFSWLAKTDKGTGRKTFTLDNLTVAFPPAKLSLICGVTGAGKTSMIYALLGEMNRTAGESHLLASDPQSGLASTTSVAFAAQQSWLMNATIRDNILFGLPYEHAKYTRVIAACALVRDLDTLPGGDMTEIGEKGVNVSGGQKARISLARAAYSDASTVLLDDPLSAVDAPTARHVFEHCVLGLMANRTRVLVTHAVHLCVPHADHVVVMKRGGVAAQGPPSEVVGKGPGKIDLDAVEDGEEEDEDNEGEQPVTATMASGEHGLGPVQEVAGSGANATDSSSSVASSRSPSPDIESDISVEVDMESTDDSLGLETDGRAGDHRLVVRLTEDETRARGAVKSEVYWSYIRASGGLVFALALAMAYTSVQLAAIGQDWWLKHWAQAYQRVAAAAAVGYWITPLVMVQGADQIPEVSDGGQHPPPQAVDVGYYLTIYAAIGAVSLLALLIRIVVVYSGSLRASRRLHDTMLRKLLCAPMRFFDTTPMGRILNRFSRDIQCLDQEVASYSGEFLANAVAAVAIVVVVAAVTPVFVGGLIPIALVYLSVARRYLRTSTELKRLDSITRSPIYSHFGETIVGAPTIRAYGADRRFMRESNARVDMNHRAFFYLWVSNRWLGVRVDFVGACVSFTAAVAILVSIHWGKGMDPGAAGLSLSYALTFTDALLWVVRMHAVMEMSMNSVERISEYLTIDQEAPAESTPRDRPPFDWPASGRVEFRNVTARYAPDLVPVLDNVSFTAQAGEKVGIVGRTGAGKSTLSLALFRFLEASAGHIFVDGVDVATVGLRDLRSRLTIIPQDPVLFTGTVRSNLDPFGQHSDLELWTALRRAHLAESSTARLSRNPSSHAVVSSPQQQQQITLDTPIQEGGQNFSQGQRQLLCLARALLRSCKVIVLDEATASVDHETDAKIQETIRTEFRGATLLCVAHRLRTVADYDKILVLSRGQVAEFGTPSDLLAKDSSDSSAVFRQMCQESGEMGHLREIARTADVARAVKRSRSLM
ncbi:P-loop containing nucleoside triphosphate hydrolase protein [Powellomyces hirtus]|nr:P-loop containing nucleoside triphosphate hydrolase protein [Powellomyces hirtus]